MIKSTGNSGVGGPAPRRDSGISLGSDPVAQPLLKGPSPSQARPLGGGHPALRSGATPGGAQKAMPGKNPSALSLLKAHLKPKGAAPQDGKAATRTLAYMNLAGGIEQLKNLDVDDIPDLMAKVDIDRKGAVNAEPGSKEELLLQRMTLDAYVLLNDAREDINERIRDFDRQLEGMPAEKGALKEFQQDLLDAVGESEAEISQVMTEEWNTQKFRDANRHDYNVNFAVDLAIKTTKLGVAVGTAATVVLSPVSVAASALSALSMAKLIHKFAQDRDAAFKAVVKGDLALQDTLRARFEQGGNAGVNQADQAAREIAVALPIAFVDKLVGPTVKKQNDAVLAFYAKSARADGKVRKYYETCIKELDKLTALDQSLIDTGRAAEVGQDPKVEKMRARVTKSLEALGPLMEQIEADNELFKIYQARCDQYRDNYLPPYMGESSDLVQKAGRFAAAASALQKAAELALI